MLLNVCCAPCSLPIIEHLQDSKLALFFYGPNIYPEEEYLKRLGETKKIAAFYGLRLFEGKYDHDAWLSFINEKLSRPPDEYPENSDRCRACFQYRLSGTAAFAKENDFDEFATTLSVSRFKDTAFINQYGKCLADKYNLKYTAFPLNADEAHCTGLELSRKYNIYRQKYCGCEFSLPR